MSLNALSIFILSVSKTQTCLYGFSFHLFYGHTAVCTNLDKEELSRLPLTAEQNDLDPDLASAVPI